ncbi:hypothetical protein MASR1M45_30410 [Candidatus Kapaibacterium sp.]
MKIALADKIKVIFLINAERTLICLNIKSKVIIIPMFLISTPGFDLREMFTEAKVIVFITITPRIIKIIPASNFFGELRNLFNSLLLFSLC